MKTQSFILSSLLLVNCVYTSVAKTKVSLGQALEKKMIIADDDAEDEIDAGLRKPNLRRGKTFPPEVEPNDDTLSKASKIGKKYPCATCGNVYKHQSGLDKHYRKEPSHRGV